MGESLLHCCFDDEDDGDDDGDDASDDLGSPEIANRIS